MKFVVLASLTVLSFAGAAQAETKAADMCQLKVNGQVTGFSINGTMMTELTIADANGNGFFSAANAYAVRNHTCVYAKVYKVEASGRVYSATGRAMPSFSGQKQNLTNSQAQEAATAAGGNCDVISCIPLVDYDHPENEQSIQSPGVQIITQPAAPQIVPDSSGTVIYQTGDGSGN